MPRQPSSRHQRPCCPDSKQANVAAYANGVAKPRSFNASVIGSAIGPTSPKACTCYGGGSTSPYDLRSASASPTRLRITSDRLHLLVLAKRMMPSASSLSCSRRDWAARSAFAFFFTIEPAPVIVCEFTGPTGRADPALATLSERRRADIHEYPSVAATLAARR
jgi:hypothetical protein